jgi:hypothetical protein
VGLSLRPTLRPLIVFSIAWNAAMPHASSKVSLVVFGAWHRSIVVNSTKIGRRGLRGGEATPLF